MININLKDKDFWAIPLGIIAVIAIILKQCFWFNLPDLLDAIVNFAQVGIAVIVFLIANKIFNKFKSKTFDFYQEFEKIIESWAKDNKLLIDKSKMYENQAESEQGDTRYIQMILDLSKFGEREASEYSERQKGAFMYLPSKINEKRKTNIQIKINQQLFNKIENFEANKKEILGTLALRINSAFKSELNIVAKPLSDRIEVDFSKMELTKENTGRLKDVVEFAKTMILALA